MSDLPLIAFSPRPAHYLRRPRNLPVLAFPEGPSFPACMGSSAPRSHARLAISRTVLLPSGLPDAVGSPHRKISELHTRPTAPLSNASSAALRLPSHGSGPGWFAMLSLYDSFIRYSMSVYPGAIWQNCPPRNALPRFSLLLDRREPSLLPLLL